MKIRFPEKTWSYYIFFKIRLKLSNENRKIFIFFYGKFDKEHTKKFKNSKFYNWIPKYDPN